MQNTKEKLIKSLLKEISKWIILSVVSGVFVGLIVGSYEIIVTRANSYRRDHENLVLLLPIIGMILSYVYVKVKRNAYSGRNLLKSEVINAAKDIPFYMIIVSYLGSLATTFFGGSAGKEGTGVCIGGTFADFLSRKVKLDDKDRKILVISSVGGAFGVLYDAPFAGAILGMEVILKGTFHYQALIPAFITTVTANKVAFLIGNKSINYPELTLGNLSFTLFFKMFLLGIIFGLVGILFNLSIDLSKYLFEKYIKIPILKGFVGGLITAILFLILGSNYNGLGQSYIEKSFKSRVSIFDFIWKIIFTAIALGSAFQGGTGNPTYFIGATLGSGLSKLFNLQVSDIASLGMIGAFCSVAALPISAIAISVEYFGTKSVLEIIIVMTVSYTISGFYDIIIKRKLTEGKSTLFGVENVE